MKKLFACLLAMMMVLSLVACSNGGNTDTENTGNDDETKTYTVGMVCIGNSEMAYDRNFYNAADNAKEILAQKGINIEWKYTYDHPEGDPVADDCIEFAEDGAIAVFLNSYGMENAMLRVAGDYPDTVFASLTNEGSKSDDLANTVNAFPSIYEGRYLAGVAAGMKLNEMIDNGEIILQEDDFLNRFSDKFTDRNPERMYNILIGDSVKEQILSRLIMQKTEEYIKRIKEMSKRVEIHPAIIKIGEELKEFIPTEISKYNQYYAGSGGIYGTVQAGKLNPDAFPPCIKATVEGVSSGGRNDAIVLLLTSFASYARLYPRIFASEETVKVSDMDPDLTITENEILPLIFDAADNCTPPLFEDQPQEKINIISKLGFGMHDRVDINHEGETKWYTPMSCEKIKIHLPSLCHPDKSCKGINNPLSCYGRKKFQLDKQQKE